MTEIKRMTLLLLMLYTIVVGVNVAVNYPTYAAGSPWIVSICFSLAVASIGWLGYLLLYYRLFKKWLNWRAHPNGNLLLSVLASGLYGTGIMLLSTKAMFMLGDGRPHSAYDYVLNSVFAVLFSMLLGLLINGQDFLQQWKKSTEDNERMKTELLQSRHEALKSQVNPHFLFNALNTLTTLIPEAPDTAVKFVRGLSDIFRYSLQLGQDATVQLITELKAAKSFIFLNGQRFDKSLVVTINLSSAAQAQYIVTHALLMLLENAVKHNEISTARPLSIRIYDEEGMWLVVANTFQPKPQSQPSFGMGLTNIVDRYAILTDKPLMVHKADLFTVKIPLLPA